MAHILVEFLLKSGVKRPGQYLRQIDQALSQAPPCPPQPLVDFSGPYSQLIEGRSRRRAQLVKDQQIANDTRNKGHRRILDSI